MLFKDVEGRKVVSTSTAETVGKVDEFVVDPATRTVAALRIKKTDSGDTVTWAQITAVGADAVTVPDASVIIDAEGRIAELADKDHRALGKRVLGTSGDELGKLDDVDFDPATGSITGLHVGGATLAGEALLGIGSYAVVVEAPPRPEARPEG